MEEESKLGLRGEVAPNWTRECESDCYDIEVESASLIYGDKTRFEIMEWKWEKRKKVWDLV